MPPDPIHGRMSARDYPLMFVVRSLFGRFDHEIALPSQAEPIRFVTAPNGHGKSTMLRLMADLTAANHWGVSTALFSSLDIRYDSGAVLTVTRQTDGDECAELRYELAVDGADTIVDVIKTSVLRRLAWEAEQWRLMQLRREMRVAEFGGAARLGGELSGGPSSSSRIIRLNPLLRTALRRINATYLDVHRLGGRSSAVAGRAPVVRGRRDNGGAAIREVAKAATSLLRNAKSGYLDDSRADEATFANRAVEALNNPSQANVQHSDAVSRQLAELKRLHIKLSEMGVASRLSPHVVDVLSRLKHSNESAVSVIMLYWRDVVQRLRRLERRVRMLELYQQSVNSLLEGKAVCFKGECDEGENEGQGLEVLCGDRVIPLGGLSDGEQHLLVMFGELLFGRHARPRGLLLLDEPENSLHPEWQAALGSMLGKLAARSRRRVLVATHSPIIIGSAWDKEISLDRREIKR